MNSINSKDDHASFIGTAPVDAFRDSVREVVSETWWNSNLGDATDRPRAKALKDRLISDDRKVGEAWLERRGGSYGRLACLTVFCETVVGCQLPLALGDSAHLSPYSSEPPSTILSSTSAARRRRRCTSSARSTERCCRALQ